ncbi:UNVERIFIED_CONTAM: hypothetical protein Sindi_2680800 [Sesamum indicum]
MMSTRILDQIYHLHRLVSISDESCLHNLRMDRNAFDRLCYMLQYSGVIKLYNVLLARPIPIIDECVDPCWKWFKGCLGALDETFIDVRVPEDEKGRYRTRKGDVAVDVLGAGRVVSRIVVFYVMPSTDQVVSESPQVWNYYLCDNGYANVEGFLTSYSNVWYHLREWDTGVGGPQNYREFFNLKHASALNVIEHKFGLLKMRWGILSSQSFYPIKVQTRIILSCCLLHNFLRQEMPDDLLENELAIVGVDETDNEAEIVWNIKTRPPWTTWRIHWPR